MSYRLAQHQSREKLESIFNENEVAKYDDWVSELTDEDHEACLLDIAQHLDVNQYPRILDVGAGTGAMCMALARVENLNITALEPLATMITVLQKKQELSQVRVVQGVCDHPNDRSHFAAGEFDMIVAKQLVNGLYDPVAAFRNWHYWLKPDGIVVVLDGMFDRSSWSGNWSDWVDLLPVSCNRSLATIPYLLELAGFQVSHSGYMNHTNARPSTRTQRMMVIARRVDL
jgi:SAM-dependent methyltransferase